jgi:hypothetical protein
MFGPTQRLVYAFGTLEKRSVNISAGAIPIPSQIIVLMLLSTTAIVINGDETQAF